MIFRLFLNEAEFSSIGSGILVIRIFNIITATHLGGGGNQFIHFDDDKSPPHSVKNDKK